MTEPQARALLDATTERLCVFVRLRPDGRAIFRSVGVALAVMTAACIRAPSELELPNATVLHEPAEIEPAVDVSVEPPTAHAAPDHAAPPHEPSAGNDPCCSPIGLGCMGIVTRPRCPGEPDPFDGEAAAAALADAAKAGE